MSNLQLMMGAANRKIRDLGGKGILRASDLYPLTAAKQHILLLMADQRWHTRGEIREATGGQHEALRRMRELRHHPRVDRIDRKLDGERREFYYRLVLLPEGKEQD